ncbi:hypothetical protein JB92DRAFT_2755903, partial [Gautieria morchelliformis]
QGNASFKSGNWADAVGHYSAAVVADRTEPTYPLNRAAAYLKLGKYRDAERDCTTVLSLDDKNVKALFRRAQARIALESLPEAEKGKELIFSDATVKSSDYIAPPLTHFALIRAWNALPAPQDRYALLLRISPESLPALFKNSLEPDFLMSMLRTFKAVASPSTSINLSRLMCDLPSIPRFNTILLFLSPEEKRLVVAVWHAIDPTEHNEGRHAWGL